MGRVRVNERHAGKGKIAECVIISAPLSALWSVQTSLLFLSRRHCRGPRETCCRPEGQLLLEGTWEAKGKISLDEAITTYTFKHTKSHVHIYRKEYIGDQWYQRPTALDLFLPHDGECGHVQSDPGAWLELCLVQLQNKVMLTDETFHNLRKKNEPVCYPDPSPTVLNVSQLMPVWKHAQIWSERTCLRHPTTYRGPLVALTMTGVKNQKIGMTVAKVHVDSTWLQLSPGPCPSYKPPI